MTFRKGKISKIFSSAYFYTVFHPSFMSFSYRCPRGIFILIAYCIRFYSRLFFFIFIAVFFWSPMTSHSNVDSTTFSEVFPTHTRIYSRSRKRSNLPVCATTSCIRRRKNCTFLTNDYPASSFFPFVQSTVRYRQTTRTLFRQFSS